MDIEEWVREEQAELWYGLDNALRHAVNGKWSMDAANKARRIVGAARLVGPTSANSVPWRIHAGGVYAAVLAAGGIDVDEPDSDEWAKLDALMRDHGGTHVENLVRFAGTVETIRTARETAWINGEDES